MYGSDTSDPGGLTDIEYSMRIYLLDYPSVEVIASNYKVSWNCISLPTVDTSTLTFEL